MKSAALLAACTPLYLESRQKCIAHTTFFREHACHPKKSRIAAAPALVTPPVPIPPNATLVALRDPALRAYAALVFPDVKPSSPQFPLPLRAILDLRALTDRQAPTVAQIDLLEKEKNGDYIGPLPKRARRTSR